MTTETITITDASLDDIGEIMVVQQRAFAPLGVLYNDPGFAPLVETEETIRRDFKTHIVLKVVRDGVLVGSLRGRMKGGICYIGRLSIEPELQKRGIGKMLMKALESRFPEARSFELFTAHKSENPINLYKRLGYEIFRTKVETDFLTLVFMRKGNQ